MREISALRIVGWSSLAVGLIAVYLTADTESVWAIATAGAVLFASVLMWSVLLTLARIAENLQGLRATARRIEEHLEKRTPVARDRPIEESDLQMPSQW